MGSKEIWNLKYREGFTFIGESGNSETCNEKRSKTQDQEVTINELFYIEPCTTTNIIIDGVEISEKLEPD